jgi:hypothetical protein
VSHRWSFDSPGWVTSSEAVRGEPQFGARDGQCDAAEGPPDDCACRSAYAGVRMPIGGAEAGEFSHAATFSR